MKAYAWGNTCIGNAPCTRDKGKPWARHAFTGWSLEGMVAVSKVRARMEKEVTRKHAHGLLSV
eukprot:1150595-Pelagomonas_calceolata.AAC.5